MVAKLHVVSVYILQRGTKLGTEIECQNPTTAFPKYFDTQNSGKIRKSQTGTLKLYKEIHVECKHNHNITIICW